MMSAEINYYRVLGISETATTSEIKKRYRSLSKQFHPDTTTGDEKIMAQINEAYTVLSDPLKRHYYTPPKPKTTPTPPATTVRPRPSSTTKTYASAARYQTTDHRARHATQQNYTDEDNSWNRALTYGFTLVFAIVLAAFALPAANRFLVKYETAAAANSANTETAQNNAPTYSPPQDPVYPQPNNSYYSSQDDNTSTEAVDSSDESIDTTPQTTPTPTPTPSTTPSPKPTSSQQAYNKWFNRHNYRYNN